jgi:hypothetical protein
MRTFAYLLLLAVWGIGNCTAVFAGGVSAPELDSGTITAIVSGITSAYVGYRIFRARHSK